MTGGYGVMDLVDACAQAHAHRNDEGDAATRHRRRAEALARAFGLRMPPEALGRMPVSGPGPLQDLQGPSHIYAILTDRRISTTSTGDV